MQIPISEIKINPGRREADPDDVLELADSIRELGLLHPIIIDKKNTLIAGLHRLEAVKLLNWTEIECTISSLEGLQAELAEIDENVVRSDISTLEFGELLLRRKEIYETLHPEVRQGMRNGQTSKNDKLTFLETKSFVQDTAEKLGVGRRTVERQIQTAKNLTPETKSIIRDTDTKIGKEEALKLSRLEPEQQKEAATLLASGKVRSVEQYKEKRAAAQPESPRSESRHSDAELSVKPPSAAPKSAPPPELKQHEEVLTAVVDDSAVPFRLPDRHFNSFAESVADLKDPNKDCSCTPDIFLAEYSSFVRKFVKEIQWYTTPHYKEVFPALSEEQMDYLRAQTAILSTMAEDLLYQVERNRRG